MKYWTIFTCAALFSLSAHSATLAPKPDLSKMTLTFSDEFSDNALKSLWSAKTGGGTINNEKQAYVPDAVQADPNMGVLRLRADKRIFLDKKYTSGEITTAGRFSQTYGYFEMRARLPKGRGLWPAFWLMPTNGSWPPEIDIMENIGSINKGVHMTTHWKTPQIRNNQSGGHFFGADLSAGYHKFAIEWRPDAMIWFVDDVERFRYTDAANIPSSPFYIIANLAVGGSWPGDPDADTQFPATMDIDYIRAYQYKTPPLIKTPDAAMSQPVLLSQTIVKTGDVLMLQANAKIGAKDLPDGTSTITIYDFTGAKAYLWNTAKASGLRAGSAYNRSMAFKIPAAMPDGWYYANAAIVTSAGNASNTGSAAVFAVKNSAGSFIPFLPAPPQALNPMMKSPGATTIPISEPNAPIARGSNMDLLSVTPNIDGLRPGESVTAHVVYVARADIPAGGQTFAVVADMSSLWRAQGWIRNLPAAKRGQILAFDIPIKVPDILADGYYTINVGYTATGVKVGGNQQAGLEIARDYTPRSINADPSPMSGASPPAILHKGSNVHLLGVELMTSVKAGTVLTVEETYRPLSDVKGGYAVAYVVDASKKIVARGSVYLPPLIKGGVAVTARVPVKIPAALNGPYGLTVGAAGSPMHIRADNLMTLNISK